MAKVLTPPMLPAGLIHDASKTIQTLREKFTTNRLAFDMECTCYVGGHTHRLLRQAVMFVITNEMKPHADCSVLHVSTALTGYFSQPSLF